MAGLRDRADRSARRPAGASAGSRGRGRWRPAAARRRTARAVGAGRARRARRGRGGRRPAGRARVGSARTSRSGTSTFSAALRIGTSPNAWKMKATVRRRSSTSSASPIAETSRPSMTTRPRGRPVEPAEQVEEGRLAAPRAAPDGDAARPDRRPGRSRVEGVDDAVARREVAVDPDRLDHRARSAAGRSRSSLGLVVAPARSGQTPTWSSSRRSRTRSASSSVVDVGPGQLEPADPVEQGELLGDDPVVAVVAAARSGGRVSVLVRPSRIRTVRRRARTRAGRGSRRRSVVPSVGVDAAGGGRRPRPRSRCRARRSARRRG